MYYWLLRCNVNVMFWEEWEEGGKTMGRRRTGGRGGPSRVLLCKEAVQQKERSPPPSSPNSSFTINIYISCRTVSGFGVVVGVLAEPEHFGNSMPPHAMAAMKKTRMARTMKMMIHIFALRHHSAFFSRFDDFSNFRAGVLRGGGGRGVRVSEKKRARSE